MLSKYMVNFVSFFETYVKRSHLFKKLFILMLNNMYITLKHKTIWPQLIWLEFLNFLKQFCLNCKFCLAYRDVSALELKKDQLESLSEPKFITLCIIYGKCSLDHWKEEHLSLILFVQAFWYHMFYFM